MGDSSESLGPAPENPDSPPNRVVAFGSFRVDLARGVVLRDDELLDLPPRAVGVLRCLLEEPGEVVTKQELLDTVWEGSFVSDASLTEAVAVLRSALGDDPQRPKFIQTVHRRGYRFVAPVLSVAEGRASREPETGSALGSGEGNQQQSGEYAGALIDAEPSRQGFRVLGLPGVAAAGVLAVVVSVVALAIWYSPAEPERVARPASDWSLVRLTSHEGLVVTPSWSPDGRWLAYALDEGGEMDIWVTPVGGGPRVQLTSSEINETGPVWSPDGQTIAYSVGSGAGGIYLIPFEGGTPVNLSPFGSHPRWSPDGEMIAFDWRGSVYLIRATGGGPLLLVGGTSGVPRPAWSADGSRLYFWSRMAADVQIVGASGGTPESLGLVPPGDEIGGIACSPGGDFLVISRGPYGGYKSLWMVPLDPETGRPRGELSVLTQPITDDSDPSISADGSKIAFTARQFNRHLYALPIDPVSGLPNGEPEQLTFEAEQNYYPDLSADSSSLVWTAHHGDQGLLYRMNLSDRIEAKVTSEWGRTTREIGGSFSPDGSRLSYSSTIDGAYELWQVPCEGCVPVKLTNTANRARDALTSWSPMGDLIAFYSNRGGSWDIWVITDGNGREPLRLTSADSNELYPVWANQEQKLAFTTDEAGNLDIWSMEIDGSEPRPLVVHPSDEVWGSWSPDDGRFYFVSDRTGSFNVWLEEAGSNTATQVTFYGGLSRGMPETALFTKIAVASSFLILPVETRRGDVWILQRPE
jgi:Tol biopolymer transport system component/DNA-binding winged helix-turn-helix (wHTH) protein